MTAPWATAHVDVDLDWGDLDEQLVRRLQRASETAQRAVQRNFEQLARNSVAQFGRIEKSFERQMTQMERQSARSATAVNRNLGRIDRRIDVDVDVDSDGAARDLRAMQRAMQAQASANPVNVPVKTDRKTLMNSIGSVFSGIAKTGLGAIGTLSKFASIAGVAALAVGSLVPLLAAAGSALATVGMASGTVAVGGLFALGVAAAALKTAFSGVGEAAKTMFDPEKAAEFESALAELSPAAQQTMRSVQQLGKAYADIVKTPVQETFFSGLGPKLDRLRVLLPAVRDALVDVAQGFNDGANGALRMIGSTAGLSMTRSLLADSGNIAANFGASIMALIPGFMSLGAAATSVMAPMTDGLGGMAQRWSETMLQMQQTGELQDKMRGWIDGAKQVGVVFQQVGGIIAAVFSAANAAGTGALGGLGDRLKEINAFLSAGEGREALISFFQSSMAAVGTLLPVLMQVAGVIGSTIAPMVSELIVAIGPALETVVSALGEGFAALQPAIAPLGAALSQIGTALAPVLPVLGQLIAQFVQIAGPIIGSLVEALAPVLQVLDQGLTSVLAALQPAIAPIQEMFTALSPVLATLAGIVADVLVQAVQSLAPIFEQLAPVVSQIAAVMGETFGAVLQALAPIIPVVAEALGQIAVAVGGLLLTAVQALAPFLPMLAQAFTQILTAILPLVPMLIQIMVDCITPLIPAIASLMPVIISLAQIFSSVVTAVVPVIAIILKVAGVFLKLAATIIGFVASILGHVASFVAGVISGFTSMVSTVVTAVTEFVSKIIGFFTNLASSALSKAQEMWTTVSTAFSEGVGKAISFVGELPGKIADALSGAGQWLVDTGKNIIQGLIDGIKSMASALINALIGLLPGPLQGAARSALGLFMGGWIPPALADGGLLGLLAGSNTRETASTPIKPGGFIVNASATSKHRNLLKQLSPRGRVLTGPGTSTSDSIAGTHNGKTIARVSRNEFYAPPEDAAAIVPILTAINAGRRVAQLLAGGGTIGREPYGLPAGTAISYGAPGFPEWVYEVGRRFNVKPSTYAGHQERDGKNKGIDWSGSVSAMQKFAEFLLANAGDMEQVIWSNPETGQQIGVADGQRVGPGTSQPGYYSADWSGHQDHVHTRQSYSFGGGGGSTPGIDDTSGSLGSTSTSGGGSTPIGSGISSGSGSSGASWGNSGGGSKFNSASDAKRGGLTAVWVENWPSSLGGGGSTTTMSTGGSTTSMAGSAPNRDLRKGASKEEITAEIVRQGKARGLSDQDIESAVATALVESDMKNYANSSVADSMKLPHDAVGSDHDSVGIMQQRQTWGTTEDLMTPEKAIGKYYDALEKVDGRDKMSVGQRAQAVQRSAYPGRYDERLADAKALIAKSGAGVPTTPAGNVPVEVTNPGDGPSATPTGAPQQQKTAADLPDLSGTPSTIGGNLATYATKPGFDAFLAQHPELGTEDTRARLSEGLTGALNKGVSGQLGAGLGMFGLDFEPRWLTAVNQYMSDNQGGGDKDTKTLADAIRDLATRPIQIVVNGGGDARAIASEVQAKVDAERKRAMRRYITT